MDKSNGYWFDHEKLEVYQESLTFVGWLSGVLDGSVRLGDVKDQLDRASTSIPLNIAEGAGEFSPSEKARFYRMARRSATECAAILHVLQRLVLIDEARYHAGREHLLRIVAMRVQMVRRTGESGTGSGTGSGSGGEGER